MITKMVVFVDDKGRKDSRNVGKFLSNYTPQQLRTQPSLQKIFV